MIDINLLIDFDDGFARPTETMLYSFIENNPNVKLNVFYSYFEDTRMPVRLKRISDMVRSHGGVWTNVPMPHLLDPSFFAPWPEQVALKFFAPYFLPREVDDYIHIDGDVIVDGPIEDFLLNARTSNAVFYGTKEYFLNWERELSNHRFIKSGFYINAGVCYINCVSFRRRYPQIEELIDASIAVFESGVGCGEQTLLNFLFDDIKAAEKDDRYMHFDKDSWACNPQYRSSQPVVIHFAGSPKPWLNKGAYGKYDKVFWKYGKRVYGLKEWLRHAAVSKASQIKIFLKRHLIRGLNLCKIAHREKEK